MDINLYNYYYIYQEFHVKYIFLIISIIELFKYINDIIYLQIMLFNNCHNIYWFQ